MAPTIASTVVANVEALKRRVEAQQPPHPGAWSHRGHD
jgi:hypothetical protein